MGILVDVHYQFGTTRVSEIGQDGITTGEPKMIGSLGSGAPSDPWRLQTPPLTSEFTMYRDFRDGRDILVCTVGKTVLFYDAKCLDDLRAMLKARGGWVELGSADEQRPAKTGTVEAWGRSSDNPVGGWYGLKKGLRGRFGMYVPP